MIANHPSIETRLPVGHWPSAPISQLLTGRRLKFVHSTDVRFGLKLTFN